MPDAIEQAGQHGAVLVPELVRPERPVPEVEVDTEDDVHVHIGGVQEADIRLQGAVRRRDAGGR